MSEPSGRRLPLDVTGIGQPQPTGGIGHGDSPCGLRSRGRGLPTTAVLWRFGQANDRARLRLEVWTAYSGAHTGDGARHSKQSREAQLWRVDAGRQSVSMGAE